MRVFRWLIMLPILIVFLCSMPSYASDLVSQAQHAEKIGKYEKAIKLYTSALNSNKLKAQNRLLALYGRGRSYLKLTKYDMSIKDSSAVISLKPDDTLLYYAYLNRALAYKDIGKNKRAKKDLRQCIKLNPSLPEAFYNLGLIAITENNMSKAIEYFSDVIELNPSSYAAYTDRGNVHFQLGDIQKAMKDITQAIKVNPNFGRAYYNRGNILIKMGKYDASIKDSTKAISINGKDYEALYNRGTAWIMKRQYDKAISDLKRAVEINPKYANAYYNLAVIYARKRMCQKAADNLGKFQNISMDNKKAKDMYKYLRKIGCSGLDSTK